ncbi:major facilitator superfamily-domain-containing protein [Stachybotrys elegans]|uniref:Major facilitator superfamily-domain-containing protein n=1 Tax=Stachybotrys elegans TaxID=80388 RepID=A0A8K0T8T9_9HYPO|nr:major facilitator superfamily-domain-containing protein [Stachybotrys elegans]
MEPADKDTSLLDSEMEAKKEDGSVVEEAERESQAAYLAGLPLVSFMTGLVLVMFLSLLDMSIIGTAIPQITSDFHRLEDVGWYVGAYQLASATVQPLAGKLYIYFDTKYTYMCFFLVFLIGSAICGAAQSSDMLIIGRAIGGMGFSGLGNGTIIFFAEIFPFEKRAFYTSIVMGIGQIGVILGPLLGGLFTEHASWRWSFYINLPIGGLAAILLLLPKVPSNISKPEINASVLRSLIPKLDLFGFVIFTPASIMFLLALQLGPSSDYTWQSPVVIGLLCGGVAMLALFLIWEWRMGEEAMIPLAIVSRRTLWTSALNFALLMCVTVCYSTFVPIYFQSVRGYSPTMSGVYMLAGILAQIISVLVAGALLRPFGYYIPWALAAGVGAAVGSGLISTWSPSTGLGQLIGFQILYGIRGAGLQLGIIAMQSTLPLKEASVGTSFLVFCQNFLTAVAVTIANVIFQETLVSSISANAPGVDVDAAVAAGGSAEAVRALVPPGSSSLDAVLHAYTDGFRNVMYFAIGVSIVAFATSFGMGWVDLRKITPEKKTEADTDKA